LIQFLTTLHSDFEGLRGLILHRSPLFYVDSIVSELLAKKIHLQSYSEIRVLSTSNHPVLTIHSKSFFNNQNKSYTKVAFDECSFCSKKVIGKPNIPYWDNIIKLRNLITSCNLILTDHLKATNYHTTILQ
jgi:hypothetical protein